jgi:hypothetical protein
MPEGPEIAVFVLLVLPGLITLGLYQVLAPVKQHEITIQIVFAVVFSVVSYMIVALLHRLIVWIPDPTVLLDASKDELRSVFSRDSLVVVGVACVVATFLAALLVYQTCHEVLHRICRSLRITRRFGYTTHWDTVLMTSCKGRWINVKFLDGSEYVGALDNHSDSSEERSLLLCKVRRCIPDKDDDVWDEADLLFIPDVSTVRSMRISSPRKELDNEQSQTTNPNQAESGCERRSEESGQSPTRHG